MTQTSTLIAAYRKDDAVLTVCQDNYARSLTITDFNEQFEKLVGYGKEQLVGQSLFRLLPPQLQNTLNEYIEYKDDSGASDLADVLGKVANVSYITAKGEEFPCRLRIVRGESYDEKPHFILVLYNLTNLRKLAAFHTALAESFKGHEVLDKESGLPDLDSINKDLELVGYYRSQEEIAVCLALIAIDGYCEWENIYGVEKAVELHREIGTLCRQQLREYDVVATVNREMLGVLLVDIGYDSARAVLNRLRLAVAKRELRHGSGDASSDKVTVSIGFMHIGIGKELPPNPVDLCQRKFAEHRSGNVKNNTLTEIKNPGG